MTISKEKLDELTGVAGEKQSKGPRLDLPTVRFDGKTGEARMVAPDGSIAPIALPAEFVILKKRNVLKAFTDCSYFTSEYEYTSSIISLFKMENGRVKHVMSATPPQLRAEYPFLKAQQVGYALYDGQQVKMEIKGKTFSSFIEYSKVLSDEKLHSYQVVTIVNGTGVGKKGTVSFKFMEFSHRDLTDAEFEQVKANLDDITKKLYNIDNFYAQKRLEKSEAVQTAAPADVPGIEFPEDEVDAEDIPF